MYGIFVMEPSRRCRGKDKTRPVLYTNYLLRCLVDSVAVLARDSSTITSLTFDGIPLPLKYLRILCSGLESNRSLKTLSLARCRIGDTGCDLLLGSLRNNSSLCNLNLSSCCLTNRSALCLSIFLKKRKVTLLQSVWEEFHDDGSTGKEGPKGLQTLILNKNHKFNDNGVKELMSVLKEDFWLKTLSLRQCDITKQGGESILDLLQTNSVLTRMDLQENNIPNSIMQVVSKILRTRQKRGGRIPLRAKLFNWKSSRMHKTQNANENNKVNMSRILKSSKSLAKQMERCKEAVVKDSHWLKATKFHKAALNQRRRNVRVKYTNRVKFHNLTELEYELFDIKNRSVKLTEKLINNRKLFKAENDRRLSVENECHEIKLRLRNLKSKVNVFNHFCTKMSKESQLMQVVRHIFKNLEAFPTSEKFAEVQASDLERKHKTNQLLHKKIGCPLQRRPYCPP